MSNRTPATHQVMMYGAPPPPTGPWPGDQPWPIVPTIPWAPEIIPGDPLPTTGTKIVLPSVTAPAEKRHVRVVTRKETDGTIKLKIYIDGELQTEVESDGTTLNAEFDL